MQWQECSRFSSEFKKVCKKQKGLEDGFGKAKRLLASYFDPVNPNRAVIAPGKIHHRKDCDGWELWKLEVMVVNLKPNLWPRVWFAVCGDTITFLAINTHNSGYDDSWVQNEALERYD